MDLIEGTIPGHILGALFVLWILAMLWEGLLIKHLTHDPVIGKLSSAVAAWLTALLIRIWGGIDLPGAFGDFNLIAAAILCGIGLWEGIRLREKIRLEDDQA